MGETAIEDNTPPAFRLMLTLRRAGASDPRVLAAFEDCSRINFVEPHFADLAMEDVGIPLACGQTSLRPSVLAMMLEALSVGADHKALLAGAGAGYSAGILSHLAAQVFAVDRFKTLCDLTSANLERCGISNVTVSQADGLAGLQQEAPFDRILLTGAVSEIPTTLLDQLAPDGVLITPVRETDGRIILQRRQHIAGAMAETQMFELQVDALQAGLALQL